MQTSILNALYCPKIGYDHIRCLYLFPFLHEDGFILTGLIFLALMFTDHDERNHTPTYIKSK